MKKQELEEVNQQLQELVRQTSAENAQLQLSLKLASAQIERLQRQHAQLKRHFEKLSDYVRSLRAWAAKLAAENPSTGSGSVRQAGV